MSAPPKAAMTPIIGPPSGEAAPVNTEGDGADGLEGRDSCPVEGLVPLGAVPVGEEPEVPVYSGDVGFNPGAIGVADADGVVLKTAVVDEEALVDAETAPCPLPPWPTPSQMKATELNSTRAKQRPSNSVLGLIEFNAGPSGVSGPIEQSGLL